jgi:hypothetical protein
MAQNDAVKTHKCAFCFYCSKRRYDLKRHHNAKHYDKIFENTYSSKNGQNVPPNEQNVPPNEQNVPFSNTCTKCNKNYKTKKHLYNHELKCKGIDELTCPKCMKSFTTRQHKYNHIKRNKCSARSIVNARTPNIQNINNKNIQIAETIQNINNIQINNFGSERIDHISHEEIVKILSSGINTLPLYIKKKHFDKCFPENRNIKYTMENKCKVFEDNSWKDKDLGLLSSTLVQDNTEVLLLYCDDKDEKVLNTIQDIDKYENIKNKLFILYNKTDNIKYNTIITKIKDLIKNCELEEI